MITTEIDGGGVPKKPTHGHFDDMEGRYFGYLKVIEYGGAGRRRRHYWVVRCGCGNVLIVQADNLRSGAVRSCGCMRSKDGMLRLEWDAMIKRFTDPDHPEHRGRYKLSTKVHESFKTFPGFLLNMGVPETHCRLKLIDSTDDFRPGNVKWVEMPQIKGRKVVEIAGRKVYAAQLARELGVPPHDVYNRLARGKTGDEILFELSV